MSIRPSRFYIRVPVELEKDGMPRLVLDGQHLVGENPNSHLVDSVESTCHTAPVDSAPGPMNAQTPGGKLAAYAVIS